MLQLKQHGVDVRQSGSTSAWWFRCENLRIVKVKMWWSRQMASFPCHFKETGTMLCRHSADCFCFHVQVREGQRCSVWASSLDSCFIRYKRWVYLLGTVHILYFWRSCILLCVNTLLGEQNGAIYLKKSLHNQGLFTLVGTASGAVNKLRTCLLFLGMNNLQFADHYTNSTVWLCGHFSQFVGLWQCHMHTHFLRKICYAQLPIICYG